MTSQFSLLTVFLRELLALSSSANFRTYNQLYTYTKVFFSLIGSVEQILIYVFLYRGTIRANLILEVHFTFFYFILQFSILGKRAMNFPPVYLSIPFFKRDTMLISKFFAILVSCSVSNYCRKILKENVRSLSQRKLSNLHYALVPKCTMAAFSN